MYLSPKYNVYLAINELLPRTVNKKVDTQILLLEIQKSKNEKVSKNYHRNN